ncbi:AGAP009274-PA-like protein [Anopheles sinensis]|uniref:AGAP009274-PA-like protein n=1 Tax=Anopheles sinensis TaxID=74873 RepID=A0A084VWG3_ANOSI|nr:AGAP009274-PA-like protein [Anopheles sinensis]
MITPQYLIQFHRFCFLPRIAKSQISHLQPHGQLPQLVKPVDHYPQQQDAYDTIDAVRYGHNLLRFDPPGSNPSSQTGYYADYGYGTVPLRGSIQPEQLRHASAVSSGQLHPSKGERLNNYDYVRARNTLYGGFHTDQQQQQQQHRGVGGRGLVGGILKNNISTSGGRTTSSSASTAHRHPLIYDLKQYEYYNNACDTRNYRTPLSVKNTNSIESNSSYNVNYSLNFTKNQYNILISPPLHPDLGPRVAVPPYEQDHAPPPPSGGYCGERPKYFNHREGPHHVGGASTKGYTTGQQHNKLNQKQPPNGNNGPVHYTQYLPGQRRQSSVQHQQKSVQQTKGKQQQQQHNPASSGDKQPGLILSEKQLLAQQEEYAASKMQREEIIIEHSQLMGGEGGLRGANILPAGQAGQRRGPAAGATGGKGLGAFGVLTQSHHFTQIIAALAVSLGPLAAGLGKGYSSPAIDNLQELQHVKRGNYTHFSVNDQQVSWIASLSLLGALFGGMFGGLAMQYGRKRVLTLMSLPFSISWVLTMFAKSVETMFFTAFVGGFCCAIVSSVAQVYVSEIASPDIRGFLSAIQKIAGHFGMLISYLLGAYLDWRQLAMLIAAAPIMLFISVIYIPETPSFLVLRGCDDEAHRSLQWLRGPHKNVELELDTIRSNVRTTRMNLLNRMTSGSSTTTTPAAGANGAVGTGTAAVAENGTAHTLPMPGEQRRGFRYYLEMVSFEALVSNVKSVLRNARLVKPILITCGLMIFQRFTGASSFNFYAVTIFRKTFAGMNPHGAAIAVGFVQLLASMLSGLLIDTVGRIPLLIVSSIFMSLALAGFGSCVYYGEANKLLADVGEVSGQNDWIPLLCVLVFTVAFALGISPISWLLVGELFPLEYRAIGSSIATSFSYFCAFLSVKTFVDFQYYLGLHGTFWLYACISCVGLFFVIMVVPETRGRDLEEMDPRYVRTLTINR